MFSFFGSLTRSEYRLAIASLRNGSSLAYCNKTVAGDACETCFPPSIQAYLTAKASNCSGPTFCLNCKDVVLSSTSKDRFPAMSTKALKRLSMPLRKAPAEPSQLCPRERDAAHRRRCEPTASPLHDEG